MGRNATRVEQAKLCLHAITGNMRGEAPGLAPEGPGPVVYEVEIRGMTVRIQAGAADLTADSVSCRSGAVSLRIKEGDVLAISEGGSLSLTDIPRGPVF